MSKLSEITSKKTHTLELFGEQFKLSSFNARVMRDMEASGVSGEALAEASKTHPTTVTISVLWHLFHQESRDFFENDINKLFDVVGPAELEIISTRIATIYEDAQPAGKKLESDPQI